MNQHNLFQQLRMAADIFGPADAFLPGFVTDENGPDGHLFAALFASCFVRDIYENTFTKKKAWHLPGFSLILTPMAPCGARGEPFSSR